MSFQVCPLCKGTGMAANALSANVSIPCSVCQGLKIINTLTGNPPKKENNLDELRMLIQSGNFQISTKDLDANIVDMVNRDFEKLLLNTPSVLE